MSFLAGFLHCALKTCWLNGTFFMIYRNNASRLSSGLHQCVLRNSLAGSKQLFLCAGTTLYSRNFGQKPSLLEFDFARFEVLVHQLFSRSETKIKTINALHQCGYSLVLNQIVECFLCRLLMQYGKVGRVVYLCLTSLQGVLSPSMSCLFLSYH